MHRPLDVAIDAVGITLGVLLYRRLQQTRLGPGPGQVLMRAVAIELDGVLGDTRPLWRDWLEDAARRFRSIAPLDPAALPEDRGEAAAELDRWAQAGVGDWRAALARFAEDRAPVYLRPSAEVSAALRASRPTAAAWASSRTRPSRSPGSRSPSSEPSAESKPSRPARARSSGSSSASGPRRSSSATRASSTYNPGRERAGTRRSPARRAPRATGHAERRATFPEPPPRRGRAPRADRPRARQAERIASDARVCRARPGGPADPTASSGLAQPASR